MPKPASFFTSLAGVPVQYDRMTPQAYGGRGVSYQFHAVEAFTATLEACFADLWRICPWGRAELMTSAGAWVDKKGRHGAGAAFDLDGIFWSGRTFVTLYDGYQNRDRPLYYGVECVLRRHYGQVLNFDYNADHRDHFHFDDAHAPGLRRSSTAMTVFVQGLLREVFGLAISIGGEWTDATETGLREAAASAGIADSLDDVSAWQAFLEAAATRSFRAEASPAILDPAVGTPRELLHVVYDTIRRELGTTALRKPIETALDNFANHPDTSRWLGHEE